jgi:hypothetical protein
MLPKLRVGLSPIWGVLFLAVAAIDLWTYTLAHSAMQLAFAALMGLVGITHLMGALLAIDDRTIELKNPLGMTLKTFVIESPSELSIEGRKLFITQGAQRKKISGLMANGKQWAELKDAIAAAKRAATT